MSEGQSKTPAELSAQLRDAEGACLALSEAHTDTQRALAASQQDLTRSRGRVVDLLYALDAFQIESGADREAGYAAGIEAVRALHRERDAAVTEAERLFARVHELIKEVDGWRAAAAELQRTVQQTEAELDILRRGGAT